MSFCKLEYNRKYRLENKEKIKLQRLQYRIKNKEIIKKRDENYRKNYKEKIRVSNRKYYEKNRKKRSFDAYICKLKSEFRDKEIIKTELINRCLRKIVFEGKFKQRGNYEKRKNFI